MPSTTAICLQWYRLDGGTTASMQDVTISRQQLHTENRILDV